MACHRTVYDWDKPGCVKKIVEKEHSFAWSGRIPCTGRLKCIYCHRDKEDIEKDTRG